MRIHTICYSKNTGIRRLGINIVILLTLIFAFIHPVNAQIENNPAEGYAFPAEFEPHESIWLTWVFRPASDYRPADHMVMEIIRELAPFVKVSLVVNDENHKKEVQKILEDNGVSYSHVSFIFIPRCNRWMRDMGPIFVKNQNGSLKIVDYLYSSYGETSITNPNAQRIGETDRIIAEMLNLPVIKTELVSEGGAREFNGKGTLLVVEAVEMQRNPGMSRNRIERELMRTLEQKKVIWLKKGTAEDDKRSSGALPGNIFTSTPTGGHIDEFCRFTGPNTILLAEVSPEERDADPISRLSYDRLAENYNILKNSTDQDGNSFRIVRIPVTDHIFIERKANRDRNWKYTDGSTVKAGDMVKTILSTSYLNFLVTNGVVLAQAYWKEGRPESMKRKDEQSRLILQSVFPDRKIIQMFSEVLNYSGGGIHCITQQQPAVNK